MVNETKKQETGLYMALLVIVLCGIAYIQFGEVGAMPNASFGDRLQAISDRIAGSWRR